MGFPRMRSGRNRLACRICEDERIDNRFVEFMKGMEREGMSCCRVDGEEEVNCRNCQVCEEERIGCRNQPGCKEDDARVEDEEFLNLI